jgi:peptidyl-prolyl cis-trans isomerase D
MLRFLRRGQRWLTALIVAGVGVVFAMFIGLGGPLQGPTAGSVVEVASYRFGLREFERVRSQREQQIRDAAGENYDPRAFRDPLNAFASEALVQRAILALEAERLGLTVSDEEIRQMVRSSGSYRDSSGRFDREAFESYVDYEWGSERSFLATVRLDLLANKMARLIHSLPRVSEAEARDSLRRRLEEVRIAFAALDPTAFGSDEEIPDERVEAFLAERESEARALYDARADRYDIPEQLRARHILLSIPSQADDQQVAAVEARAREVLERVRGGEEFAQVAEEVSEDPGSRAAGGDLGFFRRGQMTKPFEDAAFALEPGSTSDLVRTDYGFHIIRAEEREEAQYRSFESVRAELARELVVGELGREQARATAERIADAVRQGATLEDAVRDEELTLVRSGWLRRRPDGYVPELGAAQDLLATAFALESGDSAPRIFEVGDKLAMVQLLERNDPDPEEIADRVEEERESLLAAKRSTQFDAWIGGRRQQLLEAGELFVNLAAVRR